MKLSAEYRSSVGGRVDRPTLAGNGFGLCVGGLLKPQTVRRHRCILIAQMFLFALVAHLRKTRVCGSGYFLFNSHRQINPSSGSIISDTLSNPSLFKIFVEAFSEGNV